MAGLGLCLVVRITQGQTPAISVSSPATTVLGSTTPTPSPAPQDDANSSPRERGRILQKRNPIASEYQIFGDLGSSPGADVDGEGVDFRAFFPSGNLFADSSPLLSVGYRVNYNQLSGVAKPGGDFHFRQNFGADQNWVVSGRARSSSSDRQIEHYEAVWQRAADTSALGESTVFFLDRPRYSLDSIQTRNNTYRFQIGREFSPHHRIYYRGAYQDYYEKFYRNRLELQLGRGEFAATRPFEIVEENLVSGSFDNARTRRYFGDTRNRRERQHHTVGGTLELSPWALDYAFYQHSWDLTTAWNNWNFNDFDLDLSYRIEDPNLPEFSLANGADILDQSTTQFSSLRIHDSATRDQDFAWRLDAERKTELAGLSVWIQAGLLHREKERRSGDDRRVYTANPDDLFHLSTVENDRAPGLVIDDRFELQSGLDPAKGIQLFSNEPSKFVYSEFRSIVESAPTRYDAFEEVIAAYAMTITQVGKWTFESGGRIEQTKTHSTGTVVVPEAVDDAALGLFLDEVRDPVSGELLSLRKVPASADYTNVLPTFEARFDFNAASNFKTSWFRVLMRPQYFDIVNYRRIGVPTRSISEGNPSLSPTTIDKLRLAYSTTHSSFGDFAAELFLIDIESFFYGAVSKENILENGSPVEYSVSRVTNGKSGRIHGFEVQWTKSQTDVGLLDRGSVNLAYTYSDSEATLPTRPGENLPVPERSRHLLKANIRADIGRWSLGADFTYQSQALDDVGDIAERDEYREAVIGLSVNSRFHLSDKTEFGLSIFNLTDHHERSYEGNPIRKQRNQSSSWYAVAEMTRIF